MSKRDLVKAVNEGFKGFLSGIYDFHTLPDFAKKVELGLDHYSQNEAHMNGRALGFIATASVYSSNLIFFFEKSSGSTSHLSIPDSFRDPYFLLPVLTSLVSYGIQKIKQRKK